MPESTVRSHILVIEDEVDMASLVQSYLEANGYRVSVAHDGVSALEVEEVDPPDLVITDLAMPIMDGRQLISRILEHRPNLPVLVVSGYAADEPFDSEFVSVLVKPVEMSLLGRRVNHLLQTT